MSRPVAIDFYCCEGAVSRGLHDAGFDVYGVDLFRHRNAKGVLVGYDQSRYPFLSLQKDAIEALRYLRAGGTLGFNGRDGHREIRLSSVRLWWASPPCQHASAGTRAMRAAGDDRHPALIEPTRELFESISERTGAPWVIENVKGAALRDPMMLCGSMFDLRTPDADGVMLRLERHRLFESNVPLVAPAECVHDEALGWAAGAYGGSRRAKVPKGTSHAVSAPLDRHAARFVRKGGYSPRSADVVRRLLGLPADAGMSVGGMQQCVPPIYAENIGRQVLAHLS